MGQGTLFDVGDGPPEEDSGRPAPVPFDPHAPKVITERDYQTDCTNRIFEEWQAAASTLVVMATGLGKTVVSTNVCKRVLNGEVGPGGFLFIAHKEELIEQAYETFRAACPGKIVEREQGKHYASNKADIVVASNQSLYQPRRLSQYAPERFAAWCIDEAHHYSAENVTYSTIRNHFKTAKGLGLTATPDREDEAALGQVFDTVAFTYDILDGTNEGWLVPVGQRLERCEGIDFSAVRIDKSGDFNEADLAEQLKKEEPLYGLCEAAVKYSNYNGKKRSTLVFASSTEHASIVAEILNRRDAREGTGRAAAINFKSKDRKEVIKEYKRRNIRFLVNYGILGEGFDDDETRVIINGRPTKSRAFFSQMFGRVTRPLREILPLLAACKTAEARKAVIKASRKPGALLVDMCGLNHKLVLTMADILGGRHTDDVVRTVRDRMARADVPVDVEAELAKAQRAADKRKAEDEAKAKRSGTVAKASLRGKNVDPFDVMDVSAGREPAYMAGKSPSDPQINLLIKFGLSGKEIEEMTRHQASRMIDACMNRWRLGYCSFRVAKILRKHGYDPNTDAATASQIITKLKANGWRKVS